jgi:protein-L-isoaspartate O-methyltransferase
MCAALGLFWAWAVPLDQGLFLSPATPTPHPIQTIPNRDQKVTVRTADGSTLTMPPPSVVAIALEALELGPGASFLDVGCGSGYVTAVAAVMAGPAGCVQGIECVSSRLEGARANLRRLRERLPASSHHLMCASPAVVEASFGAGEALAAAGLSLSNVLIPECTNGRLYDAVYCDTSVSEEDLPSFLALLRPGGRAVVVLEEELLLLARTGPEPHEFSRGALAKVCGDFGELEDPTPWEVQEAIVRIKAREHKKGLEQAKVGFAWGSCLARWSGIGAGPGCAEGGHG